MVISALKAIGKPKLADAVTQSHSAEHPPDSQGSLPKPFLHDDY